MRHVPSSIAALCLALAAGCGTGPESTRASHLYERSTLAMGSDLTLSAWTSDDRAADAAFGEVVAEFERLDALMSVWKPGSDVLRLNEAAGDRPVTVGPDVRAALESAREISDWTNGKFDITFGALTDIWKFDQDQDDSVPSDDAIAARLPLVDYRGLIVDETAGTAFLARKGMRAHLGGIGKGYAVDRAVRLLRDRGLRDFMIRAGGDLYVAGSNGGRPWRLGIADPRGTEGRVFASLDLSDATFSTSGDYARFFVRDGIRYHHLLDPDTGRPARGCRSVTIVADSPLVADGLSTGVFVLGPTEGMALIERLPNVEGVIVSATNDVLVSSGLRGKLTVIAPPTDAP
ncbi:MAG: FAD:protein FMN transferase [Vicinamibacterales bacterium]